MPKKNGFAVFGLGAFGSSVVRALRESKQEVVAVDADPARVDAIKEIASEAIIGDITNRELLKELQVDTLLAAIVCVGKSLQSSILTTLALKDLGCPHVIAKADSREQKVILSRIGADRVVLPEIQTARTLVQGLVNPAILERYALGPGHSVIKSPVPESWVGKSITELGVRINYGVSIIAVERSSDPINLDDSTLPGREIFANPKPTMTFQRGDRLLILGSDQQLQEFQGVK